VNLVSPTVVTDCHPMFAGRAHIHVPHAVRASGTHALLRARTHTGCVRTCASLRSAIVVTRVMGFTAHVVTRVLGFTSHVPHLCREGRCCFWSWAR
jgi:hypothetical protein